MADIVITIASTPHGSGRLFVDLLAILATAVFVATLFKRVRLETIPGYLIAGALVGPHALKLVSNAASIAQISDLAIILLMFTIGLMLESDALKRGMVSMLAVGVVSTALVVLASWPIAMALGLDAPQGLAASLAFSMSSTAVLLRLLQQRRELRHPHGQLCVGVSIAQDVLSVAFLAALPLLATWQSGGAEPSHAVSKMHPAALWGLRLVAVACILVAGTDRAPDNPSRGGRIGSRPRHDRQLRARARRVRGAGDRRGRWPWGRWGSARKWARSWAGSCCRSPPTATSSPASSRP